MSIRSLISAMILSFLLLSGLSHAKASPVNHKDRTLELIFEAYQNKATNNARHNKFRTRSDDTPKVSTLGENTPFWVRGFDGEPDVLRMSSLKWIGIHSYLYIDNRYTLSESKMRDLVTEFDNVIYPKIHEFFGTEAVPGIDGDPRITLLFTDLGDDIAGYFDPRNEYDSDKSNRREMLILNINRLIEVDDNDKMLELKSTMAHEFQHLVHFTEDPDEEIWVNEGLSQYAEYLLYGNLSRLTFFYENPYVSLVDWSWGLDSYGASLSFILYFAEHYSREGNLKELVANARNGIKGIDSYLAKLGYYQRFNEVFNDWAIANYVNSDTIYNGKYGYKSFDDRINVIHVQFSRVQRVSGLAPWSIRYFKIEPHLGPAVLKLTSLSGFSHIAVPGYITFIDEYQQNTIEVVKPTYYRDGEWYVKIPDYRKEIVMLYSNTGYQDDMLFGIIPEKDAPTNIVFNSNKADRDKDEVVKYGALFLTALGAIATVVFERG